MPKRYETPWEREYRLKKSKEHYRMKMESETEEEKYLRRMRARERAKVRYSNEVQKKKLARLKRLKKTSDEWRIKLGLKLNPSSSANIKSSSISDLHNENSDEELKILTKFKEDVESKNSDLTLNSIIKSRSDESEADRELRLALIREFCKSDDSVNTAEAQRPSKSFLTPQQRERNRLKYLKRKLNQTEEEKIARRAHDREVKKKRRESLTSEQKEKLKARRLERNSRKKREKCQKSLECGESEYNLTEVSLHFLSDDDSVSSSLSEEDFNSLSSESTLSSLECGNFVIKQEFETVKVNEDEKGAFKLDQPAENYIQNFVITPVNHHAHKSPEIELNEIELWCDEPEISSQKSEPEITTKPEGEAESIHKNLQTKSIKFDPSNIESNLLKTLTLPKSAKFVKIDPSTLKIFPSNSSLKIGENSKSSIVKESAIEDNKFESTSLEDSKKPQEVQNEDSTLKNSQTKKFIKISLKDLSKMQFNGQIPHQSTPNTSIKKLDNSPTTNVPQKSSTQNDLFKIEPSKKIQKRKIITTAKIIGNSLSLVPKLVDNSEEPPKNKLMRVKIDQDAINFKTPNKSEALKVFKIVKTKTPRIYEFPKIPNIFLIKTSKLAEDQKFLEHEEKIADNFFEVKNIKEEPELEIASEESPSVN